MVVADALAQSNANATEFSSFDDKVWILIDLPSTNSGKQLPHNNDMLRLAAPEFLTNF